MEDEIYTVEDIFKRDTPLTEDLLDNSDGLTLSPITMLRRYMAEKELQKQKEADEESAEEMESNLAESMGYMNGGGIGSMMQPKQNFLNGGRVGLFMGGEPLKGVALNIYDSLTAYGYNDKEIQETLLSQGYLKPSSGTPEVTPPVLTPPSNEGNGGGGEGNGGSGKDVVEEIIKSSLSNPNDKFDRPTMADIANKTSPIETDNKFNNPIGPVPSETILDKLGITDRNRGMEDNEDFIDRGDPFNDSRIVSEEQGSVGGIPDRNRGQISPSTIEEVASALSRPNMADIAGSKKGPVDNSITMENIGAPGIEDIMSGNFAEFGPTTLDAPPSIGFAQDPNVQDPFDGNYTPSFEKEDSTGLEALVDSLKGYDFKEALTPKSIATGLAGNKLAGLMGIPGVIGSFALNALRKQSQARKEKKAAAADAQAKADAEAAQKQKAKAKAEADMQQKIKDAEAAQKIKDDAAAKQKIKDDAAQKEKTFREKQKEESDRQKEEVSKQKQDEARKNNEAATKKAAKELADRQAAKRREDRRGGGGGGNSGGGGGGGSKDNNSPGGGGSYCFDPSTLIQMADGSTKQIKNIQLGDATKGGEVTGVFQFKASDEIHDYKGVTVAGSHYVKEDGKFIMVKDSPLSVKIDKIPVVYSLDTTARRIFIKDIEFADYNGDGVAKNFLTNAGVDLSGFDKEVLRQVENRLI
jgi:hypothetical protein